MFETASADDEEEVAWDEDSDADESPSTPQVKAPKQDKPSAETLAPPSKVTSPGNDTLKPSESRRSNDQQSQADSDGSYDLVSGTTSRSPGSPKETPTSNLGSTSKPDDSDEEDWE